MANNPKKAKDPTEVALSAIQEALNISDSPPPSNDPSAVRLDAPMPKSSALTFDDPTFAPRAANERTEFDSVEDQRFTRIAILAGRSHHAHLASGTRRSQRLIRALPSWHRAEAAAKHGFAGAGQPADRRDQVDIDGADDGDHACLPGDLAGEANLQALSWKVRFDRRQAMNASS